MQKIEKVHFYFSVGSRYSYLASTQMDALERELGCEVEWRPLYSVDLYRLRGENPFEGDPLSGQYDWDWRRRDAERWAEGRGGARNGSCGLLAREGGTTGPGVEIASVEPRTQVAKRCRTLEALGYLLVSRHGRSRPSGLPACVAEPGGEVAVGSGMVRRAPARRARHRR